MKLLFFIYAIIVLLVFGNSDDPFPNEKLFFKHDTLLDFDGETTDKIPTGFNQQNNNCDQSVNWIVYNDKVNYVVTQQNKNTGDCFNIITTQMACKNMTLTAKIKLLTGGKNIGGGLVWRFLDNMNYYMAGFDPLDSNFVFFKVVKGVRALIKNTSFKSGMGLWYTLSVEANKEHVICWVNGEKLVDSNDNSLKKVGKVGFWTKADAQTYFDEMVVLPAK